ncbi:MAG: hypothetical protein ACQCXQ_15210 [Verrucomicrobiales bacterium]
MKRLIQMGLVGMLAWSAAHAEVNIDEIAFGEPLGGWVKKDHRAAEYPLSGATYRTFKPEITPTPDGGIFVSVRIDHVRGWLSSNDHATLEITVDPIGVIASAQSKIAIQGQTIASDLIQETADVGSSLGPADHAVKIGGDMVANLTSKMLRERIVEPGRVSFPAAIRHNYNLLFQSIRVNGTKVSIGGPPVAKPVGPVVKAPKGEKTVKAVEKTKVVEEAKGPEKKPGKTPDKSGPASKEAPSNGTNSSSVLEVGAYGVPESVNLPNGK